MKLAIYILNLLYTWFNGFDNGTNVHYHKLQIKSLSLPFIGRVIN